MHGVSACGVAIDLGTVVLALIGALAALRLFDARLGWASPPTSSCPERYTQPIRAAAETYLPAVNWRLYRAQLCAKSRLNPDAESHVGAKGLTQFMPQTGRRIAEARDRGSASPYQPRPTPEAGAYYMAQLRQEWSASRAEADRHSLAMASYSAGLGHLLKAQRLTGGAWLYAPTTLPR